MKSEKISFSSIKKLAVTGLIIGLGFGFFPSSANAALSPLNLGTASTYGVLANSAITSATSSGVTGTAGGDTGVGGATAHTGNLVFSGASILGGSSITALTSASNALADNRGGTVTGVELGSRVITPGAYNNPSMDISGSLTLDALGDENAVFIFRTDSTLVTGASSSVLLVNGAQACNVYWQVGSSATLGTSSTIVGHVIALASITTGASTQVNGQLIATTAAVTLGGTTIVNNSCAAPAVVTVTPVPVVTPTPVVTTEPVVTPTPVVTSEPVVTPTPVVTSEPVVTPTPVITPIPVVTSEPAVTPTPVVTMPATPTPVVTPIPVATESPVIVPVVEETAEPVTTTGGILPVTASPWGNLLILGCGLALLGGFAFKSVKFNKQI
jgi:type VI secretion system secreted protein VgrG